LPQKAATKSYATNDQPNLDPHSKGPYIHSTKFIQQMKMGQDVLVYNQQVSYYVKLLIIVFDAYTNTPFCLLTRFIQPY
jgi:hypothetical protein